MIIVSRIKDCDYPVDRSSPLGNPFKMYNESQRESVCDQFEAYFEEQISAGNEVILNELRKIKELSKDKPIFKIGCHCTPRRCHAIPIAYFLNNYSNSI
jgi:Domain of unknown function (DUF4326)